MTFVRVIECLETNITRFALWTSETGPSESRQRFRYMGEGVWNFPKCSLKKRVGLSWRSEPGAFVPESVRVSMCLKFNCPLKVEETFLTDRWYQVVPESCDQPYGTKLRLNIKPQVGFKTLRMWFFFTSLSTPGNCRPLQLADQR